MPRWLLALQALAIIVGCAANSAVVGGPEGAYVGALIGVLCVAVTAATILTFVRVVEARDRRRR